MASVRPDDYEVIDRLIEENLFDDLKEFVEIQTYRNSFTDEEMVVQNLEKIHRLLNDRTDVFNNRGYLSGSHSCLLIFECDYSGLPGGIRQVWDERAVPRLS